MFSRTTPTTLWTSNLRVVVLIPLNGTGVVALKHLVESTNHKYLNKIYFMQYKPQQKKKIGKPLEVPQLLFPTFFILFYFNYFLFIFLFIFIFLFFYFFIYFFILYLFIYSFTLLVYFIFIFIPSTKLKKKVPAYLNFFSSK